MCENPENSCELENQFDYNRSPAEKLVQLLSSDQIINLESLFKSGKYNDGIEKNDFSKIMRTILASDKSDEICSEFFDLYAIEDRLTWNVTLNGLISAFPSSCYDRVKLEFLGIAKNDLTKIFGVETHTNYKKYKNASHNEFQSISRNIITAFKFSKLLLTIYYLNYNLDLDDISSSFTCLFPKTEDNAIENFEYVFQETLSVF